jgi:hypothetical protein
MTEKLKQIAKEEIMKLPKEAQDVINAFDWAKITEEIGSKFLFSDDEVNDFQVETLLVLVGLEDIEAYPRNIENKIDTGKDEAIKMAEEVKKRIFTPLYNNLTENVKKNLISKNPNWEQSLEFILSGGDYSVFIEDRNKMTQNTSSTQGINIATENTKINNVKIN